MADPLGVLEMVVRGKLDQLKNDLNDAQKLAETSGTTMGEQLAAKLKSSLTAANISAGIGKAVEDVGRPLEELGNKLETSENQLKAAADAAGISEDQLAEKTKGLMGHMENLGHTNDQTNAALQALVQAGRPADELQKDMALSADLAAAKHMSLASAAGLIAKVYGGNSKVLKQFGIDTKALVDPTKELTQAEDDATKAAGVLDKAAESNRLAHERAAASKHLSAAAADELAINDKKLKDAEEQASITADNLHKAQAAAADGTTRAGTAIDLLAGKLKGQAAASMDTFGGKIEVLKTKLTDVAEHVGAKVGPALVTLGPIMMGVSTLMTSSLVPAIVSATVAAGPWILAIGALIAIGLVLWKNWDTITHALSAAWHWVEDEASSIWGSIADFFSSWWPLILGIFTGGLGLLVGLVVQHWDQIVGAIKGAISTVEGIVTALPGQIIGWLGDMGSLLWNAGSQMIMGLVNGIKSMAGSVMSAVGSIAKDALHAITHPWEILSPSRVTHRIGGYFAEGLAMGIEGGSARVASAAGALLGSPGVSLPSYVAPAARMSAGGIGSVGGSSVQVYVAGSIRSERELVDIVRDAVSQTGRRNVSAGVKTFR